MIVERRGGVSVVALDGADAPRIAAVEGLAADDELALALGCDLVVAARGARFRPAGVSLDAERARDHGLVDRVVPDGTAIGAACDLASAIALAGEPALIAAAEIARRRGAWADGAAAAGAETCGGAPRAAAVAG